MVLTGKVDAITMTLFNVLKSTLKKYDISSVTPYAKTAVVILNWNGSAFLEKFLPAVIHNSGADVLVVVADNHSTDDSVAVVKESFPQVYLIENDTNGGFATGYNKALQHVDAKYYVLLNSDIEVTPGWLEPLVEMMDKNPRIAACQPKIRSYQQPEKFEYAGAAGGFIDIFGYPFCQGRIFQCIEEDHNQFDQQKEIFWATGACMMVRADVYKQIGGLDDDFFAHMEEIDFCWRAKQFGYVVTYQPESVVFHVGGGTLPKKSWKKTYLNMRNNSMMLCKNLPKRFLLPVMVIRFILDFVAAIKFLADGGWHDLWAVFRAHMSFYRSLPKTLRKRSKIPGIAVSQMYKGNIVFEHYILRRKFFQQLNSKKFTS